MAKRTQAVPDPQTSATRLMMIVGCIVVVIFGWLWWSKIYQSPRRVFNAMLANNLSSYGVSMQSTQGEGNETKQRLQLGGAPFIKSATKVTETDAAGAQVVFTREEIVTPSTGFVRYPEVSIKGKDGKDLDFSSVTSLWGKQDLSQDQATQGSFAQMLYDIVDIIPLGNVPYAQRQELLRYIAENNVYQVDYANVKRSTQNGRTVFEYPVQVKPDKYIELLKRFDAAMGLNILTKLDPTQFAGEDSVVFTISVDAMSRNLVSASRQGSGSTQTFSGHGAYTTSALPATTIPKAELETKIQQILGGT